MIALAIPICIVLGQASIYKPGDNYSGDTRADGRPFLNTADIAHRSIKLRTRGLLCNVSTLQCTKVRISDRGPYGATRRCKGGRPLYGAPDSEPRCWRNASRGLKAGEEYRGEFDVTPYVARKIGHKSFGNLVFIYHCKQ